MNKVGTGMIVPPFPPDETERLAALRDLLLLDTPTEERFDRLTRVALRLFDVPIALISLIDSDRQWFKSCQGLAESETPRSISFCGHAILSDEVLVVEDALEDPRFSDNPMVTGEPYVRFYAGVPLRDSNNHKIGTLCIKDLRARKFSPDDMQALQDLASIAQNELGATELAKALALEREGEDRLRLVMDSVVDGLIVIDQYGTIESFNSAAEGIFGYQEGKVIGQNLKMLMPEPYRSAHDGYIANYLRTGKARVIGIGSEVTGQRKDGTAFPVELTVGELHRGDVRRFIGVVRDITERKQAERALRESEAKFRTIVEDSKDAIFVSDRDGKIVEVNQSALDLFGFTRSEAIGSDVGQRFAIPAERDLFRREIADRSVSGFEVTPSRRMEQRLALYQPPREQLTTREATWVSRASYTISPTANRWKRRNDSLLWEGWRPIWHGSCRMPLPFSRIGPRR